MKRSTLRQLRRELEGYTLHRQIRVMARAGKSQSAWVYLDDAEALRMQDYTIYDLVAREGYLVILLDVTISHK